MAEVTVNTGWPRVNVAGSMREWIYQVTTAAVNDYLTTPLHIVKSVTLTGSASATAPACTVASVSASDNRQRVTLALGAAVDTALFIKVVGW